MFSVRLPGSKSESQRALMMSCYSDGIEIENISNSEDTALLAKAVCDLKKAKYLPNKTLTINCGDAGSVWRFLHPAVMLFGISADFKCNERLSRRPIGALKETLCNIGAEGGECSVDTSQTSQFASALLLAAPLFKNGLILHLGKKKASMPYIDMTVSMMKRQDIDIIIDNESIIVPKSRYSTKKIRIESDWSAATFWYEIIAVTCSDERFKNIKVKLECLCRDSLQGDSIAAELFKKTGVETSFVDDGIVLRYSKKSALQHISFDFSNHPDLFPAFAVTCAALGIDAHLTGLENLILKESDRVTSVVSQLKTMGADIEVGESEVTIRPSTLIIPEGTTLKSFNDHRIAMAFAPLTLLSKDTKIEGKESVGKSYPDFWRDFEAFAEYRRYIANIF